MESVEDYGGQPVGYMHDGGWGQAAAGGTTTFGSKLQELEDRYCGTPLKKRLKLKKKRKHTDEPVSSTYLILTFYLFFFFFVKGYLMGYPPQN